MSSVTTPVSPQPTTSGNLFACSVCLQPLKAEEAYVPGLEALYRLVRGTGVQSAEPITPAELANVVRCKRHSFSAGSRMYLQEQGIEKMYPFKATEALMEKWTGRKEEALTRQKERSERLRLKSNCFINKVFDENRQADRPKPKHRIRKRPPKAKPYIGTKRYGDERRSSDEPKAQKKGKKQKESQKDAKKKGRH